MNLLQAIADWRREWAIRRCSRAIAKARTLDAARPAFERLRQLHRQRSAAWIAREERRRGLRP